MGPTRYVDILSLSTHTINFHYTPMLIINTAAKLILKSSRPFPNKQISDCYVTTKLQWKAQSYEQKRFFTVKRLSHIFL